MNKNRARLDGHRRGGFTMAELLVVVAIVSVLIAIMLPGLGAARTNSRTIMCGEHMAKIAGANLMYIQQNSGTMITAGISKRVTTPAGQTPRTQFWASDLAAQGYLPSVNNIAAEVSSAMPTGAAIFYCPEGQLNENPIDPVSGSIMYSGNCPRSEVNTWCVKLVAQTLNGEEVAAFTWYQLNAHNISDQSRVEQPGTLKGGACAFVQWNDNPSAKFGGDETLGKPGGFERKLGMIKEPEKFVLLLEASGPSWDANGLVATVQPNYPEGVALPPTPGHPFRLAGRHGEVLNRGYDGYTNMAYFDGHVQIQSTVPYSQSPNVFVSSAGVENGFLPPTVPDTIFYFQSEK